MKRDSQVISVRVSPDVLKEIDEEVALRNNPNSLLNQLAARSGRPSQVATRSDVLSDRISRWRAISLDERMAEFQLQQLQSEIPMFVREVENYSSLFWGSVNKLLRTLRGIPEDLKDSGRIQMSSAFSRDLPFLIETLREVESELSKWPGQNSIETTSKASSGDASESK